MNSQYDHDVAELRAEALLGNEAESFFNTDVGRYVKARAYETAMDCMEQMKTVDPTDAAEISTIQLDLKAADNALTWLQETIQNGKSAVQQLEIMADQEEN